jgi:glyoxylase-like metal-dependent hydrolase (beta-lactamase superfamily II)
MGMSRMQIGPVEIIMGENQSRSPFSTSLLIRGKEDDTLIDCGGGETVFQYLKEQRIRQIFLTHIHPDHTHGIHLFPDAQIFTNPYDYNRLLERAKLAKTDPNIKSNGVAQLIYPYSQVLNLSGVKVVMIHAPGHCEGFACPYFPDLGILLIGDIDLTSFGPWYFTPDSDIDQFVQSAQMTLEIDAKYYVTSHQKWIVSKSEYREKLKAYLEIIDRREEKVKQAVKRGCPPEALIRQDIIYFKESLGRSKWIVRNEQMGIAKHLKRLIRQGEPFQDYFEDFVRVHHLSKKAIEDFTQPVFHGTDHPLNSKMND